MDHVRSHVPEAKTVGKGRMSVMLWDVYDAALYAPEGQWQEGQPFALQLSYLRPLSGKKIADRSIEEMRDQGFDDEIKLAAWHSQMRSIFPDVDNGMALTGVYTRAGESIFYLDSKEIGRIKDIDFSRAFFDIWLSDRTNAPTLRRKLLGQS